MDQKYCSICGSKLKNGKLFCSRCGKERKPIKKKKRELTKSEWIGMIVGFGIAVIIFQFGSFGFVPALLIAMGCYWIVKKIADKILKK